MLDPVTPPATMILFGDFSCPFSALASHRAAALEAAGRTIVEWRAVQHLPDQPREGRKVEGELATMYAEEVKLIRSLLGPTEQFPLQVPPIQPNTALATAAYAATPPGDRSKVRNRLFEAFWFDGHDLGDAHLLAELGVSVPDEVPAEVAAWQQQWEGFERRIIPMLEMPDGELSRGLGALKHLAAWTKDL